MPLTDAPLSVRMSNAGEFGWVTDREDGYYPPPESCRRPSPFHAHGKSV
jgi:hypothetical protein